MIFIKYMSIFFVFVITFFIGYLISKKYTSRVEELKELQIALSILENKIKFTYEPLREIFYQMRNMIKGNISELFNCLSINMEKDNVETSFSKSIKQVKTNLQEEDIEIIKKLSKLLGKTDKEGQVSQIELAQTFIKSQIKKAEIEEEKNSKLYKTLGATLGLAFAIILI